MNKPCVRCGAEERYKGGRCARCSKEAMRLYRKAHPDKAKAYRDNWIAKLKARDPEAFRARRRKYRKPEHNLKYQRARMAWILAGDITSHQLIKVFSDAKGLCYLCGGHVGKPSFNPLHPRGFDHVIPRIKGGKHTASNVRVCCGPCNTKKSSNEQGPNGSRKKAL